jgi:hypothetical protein
MQHFDFQNIANKKSVSDHSEENASGHGFLEGQLNNFVQLLSVALNFGRLPAAAFDRSRVGNSLLGQLRRICQRVLGNTYT